jgi:putative SOS response-associated peptidase YedK
MRWGLIPSWADDPAIGARMINARAETVAMKPAFRSAFRQRRCLVIADGFYEWRKLPRRKQPHYIRLRDRKPFAFAGLWERWTGSDRVGDAASVLSCTIITTAPNELIAPLHNRMPVILRSKDYGTWLDPDTTQCDVLEPLLCPYPPDEMEAYPVSTHVNNPSNDTPECIDATEQG